MTVNHRLGALGYLYLAEIGGARYADSGNAGMLDLVLALQWVRANIAQWRTARRARRAARMAGAMAPSPTPLLTHAANSSQPKAAE